jgi:hypothetical protein
MAGELNPLVTVGMMIETLSKFDPRIPVVINGCDGGTRWLEVIGTDASEAHARLVYLMPGSR